jgi:hypothetical protein
LILAALFVGLPVGIVLGTNARETSMPSMSLSIFFSETLNLGMNQMLNAGDSVSYVITFQNTGNTPVDLTNATFSGSVPFPLCESILNTTLVIPVGGNITCGGSQIIQQSDIDAEMLTVNVTLTTTEIVETAFVVTNLTQMTSSALYVFGVGIPDFGPNMLLDPGDIVRFETKVMNTGTETLLNIDVNQGEHTIPQLLPMEMILLETNYTLTAMDVSASEVTRDIVVNATGLTSQEWFLTTFNVTVNLTEAIEARLEISDRVYWGGQDFVNPRFGIAASLFLQFVEEPWCPSTLSMWVHDINITNTGTDIVTGVTVEQWRKDALSQPGLSLGNNELKVWTMDCSPMFMTNEIGTMLPGETQMCRVVYEGQTYSSQNNIVDGTNMYIGNYQEYPWELLFNVTRVTNATVTGSGMTTGTFVSESTPDTSFRIGGHNALPVTERESPGNAFTVFDSQYVNLEKSIDFAGGNYYLGRDSYLVRAIFDNTALGDGGCGIPFGDRFNFRASTPLYPVQLVLSNFSIHPQHRNGLMYFILDTNIRSGQPPTALPAFNVSFIVSPSSSASLWNVNLILAGDLTLSDPRVPTWDQSTLTLMFPSQNAGDDGVLSQFAFDIGDMRTYNSITISSSDLPFVLFDSTIYPGTSAMRVSFGQRLNLIDKVISTETAGIRFETFL